MISSNVVAGIAVGEVVGRRDRGVNAAAPAHRRLRSATPYVSGDPVRSA
jgi:hypothetical protein